MNSRKTIILGIILLLLAGFIIYKSANKPIEQSPKQELPTVTINGQSFTVELATTSAQQAKGLSGRDSLPQDHGMLFVFDRPELFSFWMKGMRFPIDIIFINDNKVVSVAENARPARSEEEQLPIYNPEEPSDKALEINAGLTKKYNIKKGDLVELQIKEAVAQDK